MQQADSKAREGVPLCSNTYEHIRPKQMYTPTTQDDALKAYMF